MSDGIDTIWQKNRALEAEIERLRADNKIIGEHANNLVELNVELHARVEELEKSAFARGNEIGRLQQIHAEEQDRADKMQDRKEELETYIRERLPAEQALAVLGLVAGGMKKVLEDAGHE